MIHPRPLYWPAAYKTSCKHGHIAQQIKRLMAMISLAILCFIAVMLVSVDLLIWRFAPTIPSITQIAAFHLVSPTRIYSSDGVLLAQLQTENRVIAPLKNISPRLIDATLAIEDTRFYSHPAIDIRAILRAAMANYLGGNTTGQGASTITQQLARNISDFGISRQKSLSRKVREALTAIRIEQVYSKDEILEMYLNQIYYGNGAYGAEAAARVYFNKSAQNLDVPEAALLAGLPQRPTLFSPYSNYSAALFRRNTVLRRMYETGKIDLQTYEQSSKKPIRVERKKAQGVALRAPYFVDWVIRSLTQLYGADSVYSGWTVVTSLNWKMQKAAESALKNGLTMNSTQGAIICIDPHTGEVRAMVGGVDYKKDRFNAVIQGLRQPGSAFKPIVYTAGLDSGVITLDSKYVDQPIEYESGGGKWKVHNYGDKYSYSRLSVLDGITHSINSIAVQVADDTGIEEVISYAKMLGITTDIQPYLPIALGAASVRPIELCSAYSAFAANGVRYRPVGILSVTSANQQIIEEDVAENRRVPAFLKQDTLSQINTALRNVVLEGTGTAAQSVPMAFGKTGTTSDRRDAWFVGYTPELVTAVWTSHPHKNHRGVVEYDVMPGATGGHVAAPIWAKYMQIAAPLQRAINKESGDPAWTINFKQNYDQHVAVRGRRHKQSGLIPPLSAIHFHHQLGL